MDGARIYAENNIRKRSEQMNYLRLSSRLDAVVARLDTLAKMTNINKSMSNIVKSLESSLATVDESPELKDDNSVESRRRRRRRRRRRVGESSELSSDENEPHDQ